MAIPTSMTVNRDVRIPSGIIVGFKPTTGTRYRIELQRSSLNTTASSNWKSFFLDPTSQGFSFRDELPLSTKTYYYRARQYGVGSSNSSFSLTVSAKPQRFPERYRALGLSHNNLGNVEVLGGDLWLSSAKTAKVGQQQSTGKVIKTLRWGADQFVPISTGTKYTRNIGSLSIPTTNTTSIFQAQFVLPKGLVITKFTIRGRRSTAGEKFNITLYRVSSAGVGTTVATLIFAVTGVATGQQVSTALNETVGDSNYFIARTTMKSKQNTNLPYMIYAEMEYKMPTYVTQY